MEQSKKKKTASFLVTLLIAGTMYKLYFIQAPFYVQMRELLGYTHTQLGTMETIAGWVTQFGFLISIYLCDRFSKRKLMTIAMLLNGATGFVLATFPPYPVMIVLFCLFAIFTDMLCWPTILKTIRLMGDSDSQGRLFGGLEMGRGIIDTVVNFAALGIMIALGNNLFGLKGAIWFFSITSIVLGIAAWFVIEDDEIATKPGTFKEKNKEVFEGVKVVLKSKKVWVVSLNVCLVYCVYSVVKYFTPFLSEIYALPASLASAYAIINTYGLKMLGGPIGGYGSDKMTHSATKFIRIMLVFAGALLAGLMIFPHESGMLSVYAAMIWTLIICLVIFSMRSIFFAPMDEIDVPREYTGAAMSLGSFIGYLPGAFIGIIYGNILDRNPGMTGYQIIFGVTAVFAVLGLIVSTYLVKLIKEQNAAKADK